MTGDTVRLTFHADKRGGLKVTVDNSWERAVTALPGERIVLSWTPQGVLAQKIASS
jgi:hypothetical protein